MFFRKEYGQYNYHTTAHQYSFSRFVDQTESQHVKYDIGMYRKGPLHLWCHPCYAYMEEIEDFNNKVDWEQEASQGFAAKWNGIGTDREQQGV